ncbi:nitrogenase component 1 [Candidatus Galacturonibacter soehngenii]|uniref:Nitrogenase/oxidoreductase component 1 domain-containing protein n=1 Tax=Candidatus Galacturonatibacter soehngenii TaxID=2307010 RepID=A0A7V7QMR0_9FIRM|nr:nitrogenase component 1 [Candidatus Galacturonibacter soehngenii]KAB1439770.1 hypothetical protein F7O84_05135 [Candidatus Galacturonibacter soehngenii]
MPLYKNTPQPSGRMGVLWALAPIFDAAIIEYGSMGHMIYAEKWLAHTGLIKRAKLITTHLAEKDIALGITKRLEESVKEVVKEKKANVIFLIPSSVPEMIGTDLESIGEELQFMYPQIPIITFGAGNFKATKEQGMEEAYFRLVKSLTKEDDIEAIEDTGFEKATFNLIGSACDWSRFQSDTREIIRIMEGAFDMKSAAVFGSSCNTTSLYKMTNAKVTLVMRKDGIKAAKQLEKNYGIPYLYMTPYGLLNTITWIKELEEILEKKADKDYLNNEIKETQYAIHHCNVWAKHKNDKAKLWISNEDELSLGIQEFAKKELGFMLATGGIHMSDARQLKQNPGKCNIEVRRSTLSYDINPYELPFMGFRGTMNLCSLFTDFLIKR